MSRKPNNEPPLLKYLDDLLEKLREQISPAFEELDSTAIHQARVGTRRLAAAIHVVKPILSKPRRHEFAAMLRKLRARLGPLRDLDVMIDHLGTLRSARLQVAVNWIQTHLLQQRDERRAGTRKKVNQAKVLEKLGTWWGVREEISTAREAIDSLLAESLQLQLDSFIEHANGVSSRSIQIATITSLPVALAIPPADAAITSVALEDPHELRIVGKALRYSLEMAVESGHKLPTEVRRSFKQMQDALGQWHDYVVLAECIMSLSIQQLLAHHDAPLQSDVLNVARTFLSRATQALARFARVWIDRGEEITRVIRQTFPLTGPVDPAAFSGLKTDRDPSGSEEARADPPRLASLPEEPLTA